MKCPVCDRDMVCGFVWATTGWIGRGVTGESVVWAAGDELPKDRWLRGMEYDEVLFPEDDPKRSFRCIACGVIVAMGIERENNALSVAEELSQSLDEENSDEIAPDESVTEPDDVSEQSTCLRCDAMIPVGSDTCSQCGWSYRQDEST